jgi:hypothetical protein
VRYLDVLEFASTEGEVSPQGRHTFHKSFDANPYDLKITLSKNTGNSGAISKFSDSIFAEGEVSLLRETSSHKRIVKKRYDLKTCFGDSSGASSGNDTFSISVFAGGSLRTSAKTLSINASLENNTI